MCLHLFSLLVHSSIVDKCVMSYVKQQINPWILKGEHWKKRSDVCSYPPDNKQYLTCFNKIRIWSEIDIMINNRLSFIMIYSIVTIFTCYTKTVLKKVVLFLTFNLKNLTFESKYNKNVWSNNCYLQRTILNIKTYVSELWPIFFAFSILPIVCMFIITIFFL